MTFNKGILFLCFLLFIFICLSSGKTRKYDFTVMRYPYNPDGYPKQVFAVVDTKTFKIGQQPFPGPVIKANTGDKVIVKLHNHLETDSTSIHFHGLHMFKNAWNDGTDEITECGIPPDNTIEYQFTVDNQIGTYWYHSHSGVQYGEGLLGPIVIKETSNKNSINKKYQVAEEFDQVVMLQDWNHESGDLLLIRNEGPRGAYPGFTPNFVFPFTSLLINGRGQFNCSTLKDEAECNGDDGCLYLLRSNLGECKPVQPSELQCSPGNNIRLRLINGGSENAISFAIGSGSVATQQPLLVVMRDGEYVQPFNATEITLNVGQRIDVIFKCSPIATDSYFVNVRVNPNFNPELDKIPRVPTRNFAHVCSWALLRNTGAPTINVFDWQANYYNCYAVDDFNETRTSSDWEYDSLRPISTKLSEPADERIVLGYQIISSNITSASEYWAVHITRKNKKGVTKTTPPTIFMGPSMPLTQAHYLGKTTDEVKEKRTSAQLGLGSLVPSNTIFETLVLDLELGKRYEIIMSGTNFLTHPWHLHGYTLEFIDYGVLPSNQQGSWTNVLGHSIAKKVPILTLGDTWTMSANSYVVFRFTANNPGPWFVHCHIEWHMAMGMALLFDVTDPKAKTPRDAYQKTSRNPAKNLFACGTFTKWSNLLKIIAQRKDKQLQKMRNQMKR